MDAQKVVERHWPYDGPHTDDTVRDAAHAVDLLLRYMANATYRPIASGPQLWRILSHLNSGLCNLNQVLDQISRGVAGPLADDPTLIDDRRDRPGEVTAVEVAEAIEEARQGIACRLQQAAGLASHLGHDQRQVA